MTTITRERLEWLSNISGRDDIEDICGDEIRELARIALASLEAEPVSFDDLRDAVAEVSGGPAMEWSDIYKGHQAVPFINFNSLARIVDKFRAAMPAPFSLPVQHWEELCRQNPDMSIGDAIIRAAWWNHCAAILQGAEPVSNRDELPVVVLHMGQAMSVFEALKKELLSEHVRHAELGVMGAVNVQVWTSIIGCILLQYETSNGGCTLRVMPATKQEA